MMDEMAAGEACAERNPWGVKCWTTRGMERGNEGGF